MRRIPIDLAKGLKFTDRLNSFERKNNISLESSPGAVTNSKVDTAIFNVTFPPKRMISWQGRIYVMTEVGTLHNQTTLVDSGYGHSSMFIGTPTASTFEEYLYVAGTTKMTKVRSNNAWLNWGLTPPPTALTPTNAGGSATINGQYTYMYYSQLTNQYSNFAPVTDVYNSGGEEVLLSGFVASSDPQVSHQIILRTLNDGVFHQVASKANDTNTFLDDLNDASLAVNQIFLNQHAPPPLASLATLWRGSAVVNDVAVPYRLWVSVPGLPGSFEVPGIVNLDDFNAQIKSFGVVGGNFYIWTQNKVYLLTGEYPLFQTSPIADIGLISPYAISFGTDRATFGSPSGIWIFNGASFQQLPDIWPLFDPNQYDGRAFTGNDPNSFVVGGDDRFIWAGWRCKDNVIRMFQYSILTKTWTERDPLTAILSTHDPFYVHGGDSVGNVRTLNSGQRGSFILASPQIEQDLVEILSAEVDYIAGPFEWFVVVDNKPISLGSVPHSPIRTRFSKALPEGIFGRRIYFLFQGFIFTDVGITDAYIFINELPLTVLNFDTGEIPLGHQKKLPQDLVFHGAIAGAGPISGRLLVDGVTAFQFPIIGGPGYIGPIRFPIIAKEGRSARLILTSNDPFLVFSVTLGVTALGDENIKPVELGGEYIPLTRRQQRILGV